MRKTVLVAVLLVLAAAALAVEYPVVPGAISTNPNVARQSDRDQSGPDVPWAPVWTALERMTLSERQNSEINLELPSDASPEARAAARDVENRWNTGRYDEALAGFAEVGRHVDIRQVAVGNRWRVPVATAETDWWGNDIRIGNRDSINVLAFDIDRASGNLFAILLYQEGLQYYWSVNLSTNGGSSWSEPYSWFASYELRSLSASVLGGDCYVAYGAGTPNLALRLRRFYSTTGLQHEFQGGVTYVTIATFGGADSIDEVALTSNQDFFNNRLYVLPLTFAGNLKYFWSDTAAVTWDSTPLTGITNAVTGVDACTNEGFDSTHLWVSYLGTGDSLHIIGRRGAGWRNFITYPGTDDNTSIGAWEDTVLCTFQFPGTAANHVRYLVNYQGGNPGVSWLYNNVGGDTTTVSEASDVTLREGGGSGVIYRYYASTREYRYTWRRYSGGWSTPVSLADNEPHWAHPAIEHLGTGVFGVVYLSWTSPIRAAYFDRTDWTGVAEQRRLIMDEGILNVSPNPVRGAGRIAFTLSRASNLAVRVYDGAGRVARTVFQGRQAAGLHYLALDASDLTPGVYFVRADADGSVLTVPVTVVK
jgi:hypothetical protein